MSPVAPFLIFGLIFFVLIWFLNLRVREKVSFKRHAQRFEGDSFKKRSPGLLQRVIAREHLHTLHVLSRCAINTRLAKCLPYYAHLEIELFVRRKNYSVSYFSIIQLNKVLKVIERSK